MGLISGDDVGYGAEKDSADEAATLKHWLHWHLSGAVQVSGSKDQ